MSEFKLGDKVVCVEGEPWEGSAKKLNYLTKLQWTLLPSLKLNPKLKGIWKFYRNRLQSFRSKRISWKVALSNDSHQAPEGAFLFAFFSCSSENSFKNVLTRYPQNTNLSSSKQLT